MRYNYYCYQKLLRGFNIATLLASFIALYSTSAMAEAAKHDTSQPIEINADSLEVDQLHQTAVFSGNVVAIQGEMHLRSKKMVVHYRQQQGEDQAKASPFGGSGANSIAKVEVFGNVFMTTPTETAKGESGVYDVEKETLRLNEKVIVTQGENIIQGDTLVYNIATGKSTVSSNGQQVKGESGVKKGRVRSVFVPEKKKQE